MTTSAAAIAECSMALAHSPLWATVNREAPLDVAELLNGMHGFVRGRVVGVQPGPRSTPAALDVLGVDVTYVKGEPTVMTQLDASLLVEVTDVVRGRHAALRRPRGGDAGRSPAGGPAASPCRWPAPIATAG